ncbi:MAG: 4-hydroxy-3-methylbut-2-enyl diphosphate reductase [Mucinivorans sp.]
MGKNKLGRFAENLTFKCLVQSENGTVFGSNHPMKGHWKSDFFKNDNPIVLEIGCGRGEYTIGLARADKNKNFIGIDIKGARLWRGAKTANDEGIANAAFLRTRIEVIDSFFAQGEVSEIWITFPDPQLKKPRKRLTSAMFINRYAQFLAPGALIHLKTDSVHLHEYTKALIAQNGIQAQVSSSDIYSASRDFDKSVTTIQTSYEKRFLDEGLAITYLRFAIDGHLPIQDIEFAADKQPQTLDDTRVRNKTNAVQVEICEQSGFCFGVVRAISAAEELLDGVNKAYSLGPIVHNRVEVERLERRGLEVITHQDLGQLSPASKVLVRAHGEPPSTYALLGERGFDLVDATCPVVASLQKRVRVAWEAMQKVNGTVVILGKKGHSEVVGLTGQVGEDAVVVEGVDDLVHVDFTRAVTLLSQTTESLELFEEVKNEILARAIDPSAVTIHDTICRQVSNRNPHLADFSSRFDVIIFVSGRDSSNGAVLYDVCRAANPATHFVERADELLPEWIIDAHSVGVCGATSTPRWLMERIAKKIKEIVR